jgi:hypothetical protein
MLRENPVRASSRIRDLSSFPMYLANDLSFFLGFVRILGTLDRERDGQNRRVVLWGVSNVSGQNTNLGLGTDSWKVRSTAKPSVAEAFGNILVVSVAN